MLKEGLRIQPEILRWFILLLLMLSELSLLGVLFDPRVVAHQNIWIKPLKFSLSICIYLFTVGLVCRQLPVQLCRRYTLAFFVFMAVEIVAIYVQALRGLPSHHNFSTPFSAFLYSSMGVAIVANTIVVGFLGFHIERVAPTMSLLFKRAFQFGVVLLVLGSVVGATMSVRGAHSVGVMDGLSSPWPLVNWNRESGDLRVAHFVGLHAIQPLLFLSYLFERGDLWKAKPQGKKLLAITLLFVVFLIAFFYFLAISLLGHPSLFPFE